MVRTYVKTPGTKAYRNYDYSKMKDAEIDVQNGMSYKNAALKHSKYLN